MLEANRDVETTLMSMLNYYDKLYLEFGPFVGGRDLRKLLGYKSADAFRQAAARDTLPVKTFRQPGRRDRLALTQEVAKWVEEIEQRLAKAA